MGFRRREKYFEKLLGAEFAPESSDGKAASFGVCVAMAWDAGIELVSPLPDTPSRIRADMEKTGEGVKAIVFAVKDVNESMEEGNSLEMEPYYSLDYSMKQIDEKCEGRFDTYKEFFIAASGPLNTTFLLGKFINRG